MPEDASGQVTQLLEHWVQGDEKALHDLIPVVYQELRRLARGQLQSERTDHTLQSTALPGISRVLGLSRATVDRDWSTARVWLHQQMSRAVLP